MKISRSILVGASLLALGGVPALAQQVTGVPGSPEATTTIDGKQIPPPDPKSISWPGTMLPAGSRLPGKGYDVVCAPAQAYYLDMAQSADWWEPGASWARSIILRLLMNEDENTDALSPEAADESGFLSS